MSVTVPKEIRDRIRQTLWTKADELGWAKMADSDRALWYANWSKEKEVGELLAHFMDPRKVRVYIKDSLLKPYLRGRLEDGANQALISAGLQLNTTILKSFNKPHGLLLTSGEVICWGNSRDWKSIIISVFERAYRIETGTPYAAVLIEDGRTKAEGLREMIKDLSEKLQLNRVVWVE